MARSTQGQTLLYEQETAFGVAPGAPTNMRHNDDLAWDTTSVDTVPNANRGHGHYANTDDMPVIFSAAKESALTIPVGIRRHPLDGVPPLIRMLQAAGCHLDDTAATTVAAYVSTVSWERDAPLVGNGGAIAQIVELTNGLHYPVLLNRQDPVAPGPQTCVPQMALPSATANAENILRTFTVTPRSRTVPVDKGMQFIVTTRAEHTAAPDMAWKYRGVCCMPQPMEIVPMQVPSITFDCHAASREQLALALATETFGDDRRVTVVDDNHDHGIADYSATGAIAHNNANLISATFNWGISAVPVAAFGGDALGGVEAWMVSYVPARLETVVVFRRSRWTEFETMPQTAHRYLHIVQPRLSSSDPIWGLWIPRAKIIDAPTAEIGETFVTAQINWEASRNVITDAGVANEDTAAAPWVFALNGQS